MRTLKKLILEIGCGEYPWPILWQICLSNPEDYKPVVTPLMNEYANLLSGDQFICLDNNADSIREVSDKLGGLLNKYPDLKLTQTTLIVGDGRKLPFANKSVDVVILSDVLSAPSPGTTPVNEPYPLELCISSSTKWKIIKEALRVLKDGAVLIIGICLTPCYAVEIMRRIEKELIGTGRIQLFKQCGKFVGQSDDWHLYHAAFQKTPGPSIRSIEMIPWTPAQEKYIEESILSWMRW